MNDADYSEVTLLQISMQPQTIGNKIKLIISE